MEKKRFTLCAAAVVLVMAAGCTTLNRDVVLPAPSATVSATASAASADCVYTFTPAVQTEMLTYVTPSVTVPAPGGPLDFPDALPVQQLTATAASSAGEADARQAYAVFIAQPTAPAACQSSA